MESPEQPSSLVCINASELYPKKTTITDGKYTQVPFPELNGESVYYLGHATADSVIALSNYRLFVRYRDSFCSVPIGLIEGVECRDIFYLHINCKDARSFRISFDSGEQCLEWWKRLILTPSKDVDQIFAFAYHAWSIDSSLNGHGDDDIHMCQPDGTIQYSFMEEVKRMGFDRLSSWRISDINSDYGLCPTYPKLHIVPAQITDSELERIAAFRTDGRFPSVVYRHRSNGAIISRSSQPSVGWLGWRSNDDENYIQALQKACSKGTTPETFHSCQEKLPSSGEILHRPNDQLDEGTESTDSAIDNEVLENGTTENHGMLILDARSYTAALANRAKGGGCECTEYYPHCEVQFMSLGNIHAIRKSFQALRCLCSQPTDTANWLSTLETTKWLYHLSMLIRSAAMIVDAVHREARPVLVHCSDGWDRTPQIVSLAEIMLDPFYRTIKGFQVLIEREWLEFGHRFGDRCGQGPDCDDPNQRCPVFLQFLDCVHQLIRQFPCSFEFNESFLVKLAEHSYSCLYGTFLCNNEKERNDFKVKSKTCSVWSLLRPGRRPFLNYLYSPDSLQTLQPSYQICSLLVWSAVYMGNSPVQVNRTTADLVETSDYEEPSMCTTPTSTAESEQMSTKYCAGNKLFIKDCKHDHKYHNGHARMQQYVAKCPHCDIESKHQNLIHMDLEFSQSDRFSMPGCASETADKPDFEGMMRSSSCPGNLNTSMSSSTVTIIPDSAVNDTEEFLHTTPRAVQAERHGESEDHSHEETENEHCKQDLAATDPVNSFSETNVEQNATESSLGQISPEHITALDENRRDSEPVDSDAFKSCTEFPVEGTNGTFKHNSTSLYLDASDVCQYLDSDGLPVMHDFVHNRLQQIEASYQSKIDRLEVQLQAERLFRKLNSTSSKELEYSLNHRTADGDEVVSLPDSMHGEPHSLSSTSTDDSSWEQVEEGDLQLTRWVPDHAVTHCTKCNAQFWVINRKHHCRNCGGVFCSSCSGFTIPVPDEQLYDPVRVCALCYNKLSVQDCDVQSAVQRLSLVCK